MAIRQCQRIRSTANSLQADTHGEFVGTAIADRYSQFSTDRY